MERRTTSERLAEAMARSRRLLEAQREKEIGPSAPRPPTPCAYTIAISREAGANGCLVAQAIGQRLGWAVYDRELVQLLAEGMGVRTGMIEDLDERRANWLRECLESFATVPTVSHSAYVRHLVETLLTLAAHGECVIVGRGAAQILPPATTLRVRLVADPTDRALVMQKRHGLSREEATRRVEKTDRERTEFVRAHFHTDPNEPRHYDLILNTSRFSVEECAQIVIEAVHRLQERKIAPGSARLEAAALPV
jgi:cytidylate kinase